MTVTEMKTLIALLCLSISTSVFAKTIEDAVGERTIWQHINLKYDVLGHGEGKTVYFYQTEEACRSAAKGIDSLINLCVSVTTPTTYTKEELDAYFLLQKKYLRDR